MFRFEIFGAFFSATLRNLGARLEDSSFKVVWKTVAASEHALGRASKHMREDRQVPMLGCKKRVGTFVLKNDADAEANCLR